MEIADLSRILKRTAAIFRSGGASQQAETLDAVQKLLESSGDATVEQFVQNTRGALLGIKAATPAEIAERLNAIGTDETEFVELLKQLGAKGVDKTKASEVAALYTGAREGAFKSKPKALLAIQQKFDEKVYLASKARLNERVSPW